MKQVNIKEENNPKIPYRWFLTSSGKLVVGGKSSTQNDELLKELKRSGKEYLVMHTSHPGSPFVVVRENPKEISKEDILESAIFTGCFSRAWKEKKKKTTVDIFLLSQLYKTKEMKTGTWGVKGKVQKREVELKLVITKQKGKLRAVPESTVENEKDILLKIVPGKNDKLDMLPKLIMEMKINPPQEEILSALPAGGVSILRK